MEWTEEESDVYDEFMMRPLVPRAPPPSPDYTLYDVPLPTPQWPAEEEESELLGEESEMCGTLGEEETRETMEEAAGSSSGHFLVKKSEPVTLAKSTLGPAPMVNLNAESLQSRFVRILPRPVSNMVPQSSSMRPPQSSPAKRKRTPSSMFTERKTEPRYREALTKMNLTADELIVVKAVCLGDVSDQLLIQIIHARRRKNSMPEHPGTYLTAKERKAICDCPLLLLNPD